MHKILKALSVRKPTVLACYGLPLLLVAFMTAVRVAASLDDAPFLLYLPAIFLISLALGRRPGFLATAASTGIAGYLFGTADEVPGLSSGQVIALIQYAVVASAMVMICDALRRAIIENETTRSALDEANAVLRESQASLEAARDDAETARLAAENANQAKSEFLANMSHELRTPLSAVIGYSEMLEEEAEEIGGTNLLEDLGKIKSNAKHLLSLINDVLDLSKVEANKMETFAESIEVSVFARDAVATVETLVQRKRNTLVLDIAADVGRINSDAVKLRQCLFNLLSNACKFTEDGTITLRARREAVEGSSDWLTIEVEDTGIGMTPEQVERLFQRFTQADESTTRRFGGTGLGLALSRAFSHLLGGDITVESRVGQGTCFTLRVPAELPATPADETKSLQGLPTAARDGRDLVLVIDDEASQRDLMSRFLERQNFAVRTASDGRTGLDLARELRPRAILLDVMMPDMDGWSVLRALKDDPLLADIPVVMVSFVAEAALSASLGAADAVPKPVDWARLKSVMDRFRESDGDILVVDDDPEMRHRLRVVLEKNGWSVREAENGAAAIAEVERVAPRLVLLDLTMPVMDGFAFLHRLREMPGRADIPVVVLSARDVTPDERRQLSEADRVLRKGEISMVALAAELRTVEHHPT